MKKKDQNEVLYLTEHIIEEYWGNNQTPLRKHIHKDILWIGSMDEEYIRGSREMLKRLEENSKVMPPVFLDQQEYEIVQNEGSTCVVAGRYRAFTKPESGMLLSEKQRVTFVWEKLKVKDHYEMQIKHLHLSNTLHIQSEEERFPTKAGRESFEYMQRILAERSRDEVMTLKDRKGVNHIINYSDIMYLKADGNYVQVVMGNGQESIQIRERFSIQMDRMPDGFVKVSRNVGVNRSYVKKIYRRKITMMDGMEYQIPAAIYAAVQQKIKGKE